MIHIGSSRRKHVVAALTLLGAAVLLVWTLYPLAWMVVSSLKPATHEFSAQWFGFRPTFRNYGEVLREAEFLRGLFNSFLVTTISIIVSLILGTPTAYALARYDYRFKGLAMIFVLLARMTPPVVLAVPFFLLARSFGIADTYLALVAMGAFLSVPFVIWMMRGFFAEIPRELEESAIVDGCSRLTAVTRIVLPLVAPGFAATAVLCALLVWNEFFFMLILSGPATRTLPVLVNSYVSERSINWSAMSAAGTITVAPLVVFGILAQRHLVRGLTMGSLK
ncbi:carbohydrate ABC transporter permease [Sediminispirochaeta smaragdinae]|jgi:multiple sugar transport system permease protein|uniref:Binding-protein-dependent transport systems inner membrane component n=1 Tax=Sediminispirochaeta smaragdinae (strain DSM 11293 / JCM 15392 / SEBR 4228) TaxID=573413 RepID=E1RAT4_SEDSS|nr:carbohydrate ABC transporter permease [Sediminispirochaeta smaragdinae]ADK82452.1 binding-protein-dependent transport systems inner membrane component [Sediminispirochaeta smaragdinae DSM 11293]